MTELLILCGSLAALGVLFLWVVLSLKRRREREQSPEPATKIVTETSEKDGDKTKTVTTTPAMGKVTAIAKGKTGRAIVGWIIGIIVFLWVWDRFSDHTLRNVRTGRSVSSDHRCGRIILSTALSKKVDVDTEEGWSIAFSPVKLTNWESWINGGEQITEHLGGKPGSLLTTRCNTMTNIAFRLQDEVNEEIELVYMKYKGELPDDWYATALRETR
jgi:hypothetical protein